MTRTYLILAFVLLVIAFGLIILPGVTHQERVNPEALHYEIVNQARYLKPDDLAARIIDEEPTLFLIDLRLAEDFIKFSLPGAVNIPVATLLDPDHLELLNEPEKDIVLYSTGDIYAEQCWVLLTRLGFKNIFVLEGGLNRWFRDIMQPVAPPETASASEIELYSFRKAASQYFRGSNETEPSKTPVNESIQVTRKKKKTAAEGGC